MLKQLKDGLKQCSRYGTVDGKKKTLTQYEDLYFSHAVGDALGHLSMKTSSDPIKTKWQTFLYDSEIDINDVIFQLQEQFPEL